MGEGQEITAELDEWKASIKKHDDQYYDVPFVDLETGIISLGDASHVPLEHGDQDLYFRYPRRFAAITKLELPRG